MIFLYLIGLLFFWTEVYYVFNKIKLDEKFNNKDILSTSITDLIYYFTRILYYIWLISGVFTDQQSIFVFLICLRLLSFPFYYVNKKLFVIWDNILPSISIIFIIIIITYGLFN
jgi:hypothetical protein